MHSLAPLPLVPVGELDGVRQMDHARRSATAPEDRSLRTAQEPADSSIRDAERSLITRASTELASQDDQGAPSCPSGKRSCAHQQGCDTNKGHARRGCGPCAVWRSSGVAKHGVKV